MEPISKKLLKYYDHFTERVLESVYPLRGNVNVLNHGDLWVNNMFFKYDSNSAKCKMPNEVRFVSFTDHTVKLIFNLKTLQIADRFPVVLLWEHWLRYKLFLEHQHSVGCIEKSSRILD